MKIVQGIYGLPQAGILVNKILRKQLAPHGYYKIHVYTIVMHLFVQAWCNQCNVYADITPTQLTCIMRPLLGSR